MKKASSDRSLFHFGSFATRVPAIAGDLDNVLILSVLAVFAAILFILAYRALANLVRALVVVSHYYSSLIRLNFACVDNIKIIVKRLVLNNKNFGRLTFSVLK